MIRHTKSKRGLKRLSVLAFGIILLIVLSMSIIPSPVGSAKSSYGVTLLSAYNNSQTESAVNYLTNVMFVRSVGLDKAAPIAEPNTVWLTNDNIIAYAVLSELNNPTASTLNQSLAEYGISGNGLVEVLLNKTIEPIRASNSYSIATIGQYTIKEDIRDGSVMQDFNQYADLCFWWSQNLLLSNDITGAINYFNQGMSMWNGTGFLDKPFYANPTEFQTFKVGLALWMAERLNWTTNGNLYQQTSFTEADYSEMQNIIWTMQNTNNGGIHTGYTSTFETNGSDNNVETTAICLLYQLVPSPSQSPTPPPTLEIILLSLIAVSIVCASVITIYEKKIKPNTQTKRSK
jgi:hypothetical protein